MTLANQKTTAHFQRVLNAARQLPVTEQRRLLDELAALVQVRIIQPNSSPEAIQRGQQMAEVVRDELKGAMTGSLDEIMTSLRGRSW